ncbi:MAG TPA: hypothetical protein DF637_03835 [Rikenellaceae bacterium]|nr:hypothetical protein [Rikenellaceae bacterium]
MNKKVDKQAVSNPRPRQNYRYAVAIIIVTLIFSYIIVANEADKIIKSKAKILQSIAMLKVNSIEQKIRDELIDANKIASDFRLNELLLDFQKKGPQYSVDKIKIQLKQIMSEHSYSDIIITDSDGVVLLSASESVVNLDSSEFVLVDSVKTKQKSFISDGFYCNQENVVSIIHPIKCEKNTYVFNIIFRINSETEFFNFIDFWPLESASAETYIFKIKNDKVQFLSKLRHFYVDTAGYELPLSETIFRNKEEFLTVGFVSNLDYRNKKTYSFISPINSTQWYLASKIDKKEFMQELPKLALFSVASTILVIITILISSKLLDYFQSQTFYKEIWHKEKQLREYQERFKTIMENLKEGVITFDIDGKIQFINCAALEMTGFELKETTLTSLSEIFSLKDEHTDKPIANILQNIFSKHFNTQCNSPILLLSKTGEEIPIVCESSLIEDDSKLIIGATISFFNDTDRRVRERALKSSEEKFKKLFEEDLTGNFIAYADGSISDCNSAFVKMFGFSSKAEILNRNIASFYFNPDDRVKFLSIIRDKKILYGYETELIKNDGTVINCVENTVGEFDNSGNLLSYNGYIFDITNLKNAVKELSRNKQILSSIIETQKELICRFLPDTTITYVNSAYCNLIGFKENELLGQKYIRFVPEYEIQNELNRIRKLNRANPTQTSVCNAIKSDKSVISVEWTDQVILDNNGNVIEIQTVGRDITEKLNADQEAKRHLHGQELLRSIASGYINIPNTQIENEVQLSLEKIGKFLKADRVYIFEYNWEKNCCSNTHEWCEQGIEPQIDLLQNIPLETIPQWVETHQNGKPLYISDVLKMDKDDNVRKILEPQGVKSLLTIPLINNNKCTGFLGLDSVVRHNNYNESDERLLSIFAQLLINVTNRQILEQSLLSEKERAEESNKLKTAFLQNLSHEIRTPMNGIMGFSQLLKEFPDDPQVASEYLDVIDKSGQRLLRLVDDLVSISKIEAGIIVIEKERFNINDVLDELYQIFHVQAEKKGLKLVLENRILNEDANVCTDKTKVYQIISNLISNSIKFTENGSVNFGCNIEDGMLNFHVADTGIGIPLDKQDVIFDRFIQGDTSINRGYEGSGLGLSISKAFVSKLKGHIWLKSELGKGSTFYVNIPCQERSGISGIKTEIAVQNEGNNLVFNPIAMIAEDDDISLLLSESLIKPYCKKIFKARNGSEAIEIFKKNPETDLIIMDLKMPIKDGYTTIKEIRSLNNKVIIIAQSAYNFPIDIEKAFEAGSNYFLNKPLNVSEFKNILDKIINLKIS